MVLAHPLPPAPGASPLPPEHLEKLNSERAAANLGWWQSQMEAGFPAPRLVPGSAAAPFGADGWTGQRGPGHLRG